MKSVMKSVLSCLFVLGLLFAATAQGQDKEKKSDDKKSDTKKSDEKKGDDKKGDDKKGDDKKDPTKDKTTEYYPLKEGMTWTYKSGDKSFTVKVAGTDKKGDPTVSCSRLETRNSKGELIATEHIAIKEDGVYRYAFENSDAKPPLRFLKLPVDTSEKTWKFDSKIGGQDVKGTFKMATEKDSVKIGAKEYKDVISVSCEEVPIDNQKVALTYYFAPKVGMIRQVVDVAGAKVTIELEKVGEK